MESANDLKETMCALFNLMADSAMCNRFEDFLNGIPTFDSYEDVCKAYRGTLSTRLVAPELTKVLKPAFFEECDDGILSMLKGFIETVIENKDKDGVAVLRCSSKDKGLEETLSPESLTSDLLMDLLKSILGKHSEDD